MKLWIEEDIGFVTVSGTMPIRVATPDEIKEAHPKCGECRHFDEHRIVTGHGAGWGYCMNGIDSDGIDWHTGDKAPLTPNTTDYCNKWEAK